MNTIIHLSRVKRRTMCCIAFSLALAAPAAIRAQSQCYIDPVTGERVCAVVPGAVTDRAPALDFRHGESSTRHSTLDRAAHCRITVADGSTGSGTLVGVDKSTGLVLTCAHLFDGSSQNVVVAFPGGGRFAARLLDRDRAHDLAALAIQPPRVAPIVVSSGEPGGVLSACGFGPNGQFRCVRGNVNGQATAVGANYPSLTIGGAVRPGDSGGGVLNTRGELVGVVWGQRDCVTYATCGRPVREFLNRIRGRVARNNPPAPSTESGWTARLSEIDQRITALDGKKQDKGDYALRSDLAAYVRNGELPSPDTSQFAQRTEIDGRLKSLSTRFEAVHSRVETIRQTVEQVAASKGGFFQGLSMSKLVVGALGLSGPLAAAVIVAGGLAGRRLKRAPLRVAANRVTPTEREYEPVVVDSPIPPQRIVPETHYVPIEKDSFAKAHQWASEHVARKYPGAAEILQAQDSLIKQFIAGR